MFKKKQIKLHPKNTKKNKIKIIKETNKVAEKKQNKNKKKLKM